MTVTDFSFFFDGEGIVNTFGDEGSGLIFETRGIIMSATTMVVAMVVFSKSRDQRSI